MLLLSEAAIVSGSLKYASLEGETMNALGLAHFFTFVILILIVEGIHRKFKKGETDFNDAHESMSKEEFDIRVNAGEELVLLDDLVLNITQFKTEHPGGRFLLEHNIGRDISKFFYGGYVLENGVGLKPVRHSNVARNIVNDLIVGRLGSKAQVFSVRISASQVINHFSKAFILRVEGPQPNWKQLSSTDLNGFGRHYLLRSYHNGKVKRHYTAAASMKKDAYD